MALALLVRERLRNSSDLSLSRGRGLTLGMDTLAWRPLIFTLSGLMDRSVWPWVMLREPGVVPSVLDSLGSCLPVWLCADPNTVSSSGNNGEAVFSQIGNTFSISMLPLSVIVVIQKDFIMLD